MEIKGKRKNIGSVISIIMAFLIIISTVAVTMGSIPIKHETNENYNLNPPCDNLGLSDGDSYIEVSKKIGNLNFVGDGRRIEPWYNIMGAEISDTVRFNITITYHQNCESGYKARDINVIDILPPCLIYAGGTTIVHGDNVFTGESMISGNTIIWNLTKDYGIELLREGLDPDKLPVVFIEFNATVIDYTDQDGENNVVEVTAFETCCGYDVEGHDEATVIVVDVFPTIEVTKTANPEEIAEPGGLITFTVEVENTGDEAVTLTSLVDDIHGDLNGMGDCVLPQVIAAENTYTCSFQVTVTGNAGDDETDTVTANAEDDEGNPATDSDSATVTIIDGCYRPGIDVTKFVKWDCCGEFEKCITFDINEYDYVVFKLYVNNTGEIPLDISVKDILPLGLSYHAGYAYVDGSHQEPEISGNYLFWNFTNVPSGTSIVITFRADVDNCGEYINVANVTGEYDCQEKIYDEDTATINVTCCEENPSIDLVKEADVDVAFVGDTITYTYTVTNTGDVTLIDVWVFDELLSEYAPLGVVELAPTELTSGVLTYVVQESDCPGPIVNTAVACGMSPCWDEVFDEDTATVNVDCPPPPVANITVEKFVKWDCCGEFEKCITFDINEYDYVVFKFYVNNTGEIPLDISVKDILPLGLSYHAGYAYVDGSHQEPEISGNYLFWNFTNVPSGTSIVITFRADVDDCGEYTNVVNVTGEYDCQERIYDEDTATVVVYGCEIEPPLLEKKVWNESSDQWEESITAEIGDIVRFNITVSYVGENVLYNINITDTLPDCLKYDDNADPVESGISDNVIFWNLTGVVLQDGQSYFIEFDAEVVSYGININVANLVANECSGEIWYDEDTAIVNVYEPPLLEKKVWNESSDQWEESITAEIGDIVRFNITVSYVGENVLYNINITDTLPDCLKYDDNADPVESGISDNVIFWNLTGVVLQDGQSYFIEFDAEVVSYGININVANLVANECSGEIWYDEDTAIVNVYEPPLLEKKVWNESSDQWEESITAEIGDIVRFNITVSYVGENVLYNINITDTLPDCLKYDDNADPVESGISDNVIFWNLTGVVLQDGQSYFIEFDAEVVSYGININVANLVANECSGEIWYDEDTAIVNVYEPPLLEKKVWNESSDQWEESITAEIGDIVRFNITVSYYGVHLLYKINVTDTLPDCLKYDDNADPKESGISGNVIFWNLTEVALQYGQSYFIEFDTRVISIGTNVNIANVTAWECNVGSKFSEDTATVYAIEIVNPLNAEAGGPYSGYTGETIQFTGSATGGKPPYTYNWDLDNDGEYDDATGSGAAKSWETVGTYTIGFKVIDNIGKNDTDTAQVTVSVENTKPNKPEKPTGETSGRAGNEYTYSTRSVDPEGDQVRYEWDWGDGTTSGWIGPYNSGVAVETNHTWEEKDNYEIKVRARDTSGLVSDWSDPLPISMPYNRHSNSLFIQILEKLMERFPLLEQFLSLFPVFDNLLSP